MLAIIIFKMLLKLQCVVLERNVISEQDVRQKLGNKAKYLLRALTKLGRLASVQTGTDNEVVYSLV